MSETTLQPERAGAVGSTRLLGRPGAHGPNRRNVGTITCLGCLAWPEVHRMKSTGIWMVWCLQCGRSTTGDTRELTVAGWNKQNERLHVF